MNKFGALVILAAISACEGPLEYTTPIVGPQTKDADAFAIAYLDGMQERSFTANREHCGLFGRDGDGFVIATPPLVGERDTCRPPEMGENFNAFASYHSHGAFDFEADSEVPSSNDVRADMAEGVIGYVSTPGGRVWRISDNATVQICGKGCLTTDPEFVPLVYGHIAKHYTTEELDQREAE